MRKRLVLVLLLAAEFATLVLGLRLRGPLPVDWRHPHRWLDRAQPDDVLLAAGRLVLVVVGAWLLATTLLALISRLLSREESRVGAGRAVPRPRTLRRVVPTFVYRVVEGAFLVGVIGGATAFRPVVALARVAEPAAAEARPLVAPLGPVRDGRVPGDPTGSVPHPSPASPMPSFPSTSSPSLPTPPDGIPPAAGPWLRVAAAPPPEHTRHVVQPGESLWTIAVARLRAAGTSDPGTTIRYWREVCEANRDRLRSGDVNLVHPGEDLELPPVA